MKNLYIRFFSLIIMLSLLPAAGFSQKKIMFIGRGDALEPVTYQSDKDIFDSLTAWGYVPEYWSNAEIGSGLQSSFYGDYDGIFIAETVNSGDMNSIATDGYELPIVNLEGFTPRTNRWAWNTDDAAEFYQAAEAAGTVDDNSIIIKDNSHYITKNFNVGDEVPWTTAVGADQTAIRSVSWKEAQVGFTHKLAVNKAHAAMADFWHMIALDDTETPGVKIFMWGVVHTGLDGGDPATLSIGSPEFFTLLKRGCDWTYDEMEVDPTAVNEFRKTTFDIKAFPNPSSDRFLIRFNAPRAGTAVATIYSLTGQRIASFNKYAVAGRNSFEINASDYAAGIYHVGIELDGRTEYLKLVVR